LRLSGHPAARPRDLAGHAPRRAARAPGRLRRADRRSVLVVIAAEAGRGPPGADGGSPSAFYVRAWNEIIGPKSERFRDLLSHFAREGLAWVAEHGARPGERVLDVGCGWGRSTRALARRVGPGGHVVGIDCTTAFIEVARREAAEAGVDNV